MTTFVTVEITVPRLGYHGDADNLKWVIQDVIRKYTSKGWSPDHRFDWPNMTVTIPEQVITPLP